MHHGAEFTVVLIAAVALVIGATLRLFSKAIRIPYTISMLLVGIAAGFALEVGALGDVGHVIGEGANISSDLIIFVFLPALVFESAYAIDVHEFKKNLGAVVLLAGPALLLSTVMTAGLMVAVTVWAGWDWAWPTALVFGALISATDPVAVVAILRELGVTKRLGILIEGESLLNDGTSIVVFTLLVQMLTGATTEFDTGSALVSFLVVVGGGIAVGVALSFVATRWIGRVFNDPMSEITLTLVLAYSAMIVAEGMLHVSGVMAVVVSGLWMSSLGRTKISPEVAHFLHRFWELLGYIANTLIFFLVGLVIAIQVEHAKVVDLVLIVVAYVGVMAIRFVLTYAFQPFTNRFSEGVSSADSAVMSWGGLRGAVSLALALVVFHNADIDAQIRGQILLVTAGVVLLTILVNGATIGKLLSKLGYDLVPLSKQLAELTTRAIALDEVKERLEDAATSRDLRAVSWTEVERRIDERRSELEGRVKDTRARLRSAPEAQRIAGFWARVLDVERQAYWGAFAEGTLSGTAVAMLSREINHQLDRLADGQLAAPAQRAPVDDVRSPWSRWFRRTGRSFEELALVYDLSRGESRAAAQVLSTLGSLRDIDDDVAESIRHTYEGYLRSGKERIEDIRTNLPELAGAIEKRLAGRIELNFEREAYEHLVHRGALEEADAQQYLRPVEERMHELMRRSERVAIPETADLVASTPMFRHLGDEAIAQLAKITEEMVLRKGETLFHQGDEGDAMYVVARGAAHVSIGGTVVDVLGGGDIIGEMALLTGEPRNATITAATSLTLGRVRKEDFDALMKQHPALSQKIWDGFTRRSFDNHLRQHPDYAHLDRKLRLAWLESGRAMTHGVGSTFRPSSEHHRAFLLTGRIRTDGRPHSAPSVVSLDGVERIDAETEARVVLLPPL